MGAKHRREIWNSRKQTSPRLCRSRKAQPTSPERFVGQEKHKKGGEKSHAKTLRLRQQPRMNQPSREASSFVPDPRNYGGQDGGQAADLRRWRYGDGAMGRSLTPQLIPVLQAVCAPGFADGVSLF